MKNLISESFVQQCKELYDLGISLNPENDIAKEVLSDILLLKLKNQYVYNQNPIIDLINNYDCAKFNIGMISFYPQDEVVSTDNYIIFASDSSGNNIAISKDEGKIVIIDSYYEFIENCCDTSESFLTNLIKVGNANIKHLSNKEKNIIAEELVEKTDGNLFFYLEAMGAEKI